MSPSPALSLAVKPCICCTNRWRGPHCRPQCVTSCSIEYRQLDSTPRQRLTRALGIGHVGSREWICVGGPRGQKLGDDVDISELDCPILGGSKKKKNKAKRVTCEKSKDLIQSTFVKGGNGKTQLREHPYLMPSPTKTFNMLFSSFSLQNTWHGIITWRAGLLV